MARSEIAEMSITVRVRITESADSEIDNFLVYYLLCVCVCVHFRNRGRKLAMDHTNY